MVSKFLGNTNSGLQGLWGVSLPRPPNSKQKLTYQTQQHTEHSLRNREQTMVATTTGVSVLPLTHQALCT